MTEHWKEREKLEKDPLAGERVCANEVCACTLEAEASSDFCSQYCRDEGVGRGEGVCQCGHIPCA